MQPQSIIGTIISWLFALVVIALGVLNMFWGNDFYFGVFLLALSLVFMPPVTALIQQRTGFRIPLLLKVAIGAFIIWAAFGVGELFDKIDLMKNDL